MKRLQWFSVPVLAILFCAALLAACSGGGDGGDAAPCAAPTVSVNGTWSLNRTVQTDGCGDEYSFTGNPVTITQNGSAVSTSSLPLTGQLCGNVLTFSGSYADGSGTTSETITFTVYSGSPMTLSGSGSWTWTGSYSCSGSDSYTATKQ
jgi:hypothetical protein